jgi:hypothetical protein
MNIHAVQLQQQRLPLPKAEIDAVFQVLSKATKRIRPEKRKKRIELVVEKIQKIAITCGLGSFLVLLLLAVISVWEKGGWVYWSAVGISIVTNLCAIGMLMEPIILGAPSVYRIMKNPFDDLLARMHEAAVSEAQYVEELSGYETVVLEYALTQYKAERSAFARRTEILAGALEKVGIFPAMLAYFAVASSVLKEAGQFVTILVWTVPAFYCLAFAGGVLNLKMDRIIALLEYSIKLKRSLIEGRKVA